jgi:hypothetical protein
MTLLWINLSIPFHTSRRKEDEKSIEMPAGEMDKHLIIFLDEKEWRCQKKLP